MASECVERCKHVNTFKKSTKFRSYEMIHIQIYNNTFISINNKEKRGNTAYNVVYYCCIIFLVQSLSF